MNANVKTKVVISHATKKASIFYPGSCFSIHTKSKLQKIYLASLFQTYSLS